MTLTAEQLLRDLSLHYGAGAERLVITRDEAGEMIDMLQAELRTANRLANALQVLMVADKKRRASWLPETTWRQSLTLLGLAVAINFAIDLLQGFWA